MMVLAIIWGIIFVTAITVAPILAFASACAEAAGEEGIYPTEKELR